MYASDFYEEYRQDSHQSALVALSFLFGMAKPASVIDVGCGAGTWLAACETLGVRDICGVDGPWVSDVELWVDPSVIRLQDLEEPLTLTRTFDLAMSLEVAEHLHERSATTFVRSLTTLADVVLFSAAIPLQGGTHHVNERWPLYWAELFADEGFACFDALRPALWNDKQVEYFYRQNALIFIREGSQSAFANSILKAVGSSRVAKPLPLVHPEKYLQLATFTNVDNRLLLRRLPALAIQAGHRRLKQVTGKRGTGA